MLAGTKIAGRSKVSSFIRQGVGSYCWLVIPSCETSHGCLSVLTQLGWVLRWCTPSIEVKAASLSWQSPGGCTVSCLPHSTGQRSYKASPDLRAEEASTTIQWDDGQRMCGHVYFLFTNDLQSSYIQNIIISQDPLPQSFIPLWHQIQA